MLVTVPVSNTSPIVASTTPPVAPAAKAKDKVATLRRGGHKVKLSTKAQAAADNQK